MQVAFSVVRVRRGEKEELRSHSAVSVRSRYNKCSFIIAHLCIYIMHERHIGQTTKVSVHLNKQFSRSVHGMNEWVKMIWKQKKHTHTHNITDMYIEKEFALWQRRRRTMDGDRQNGKTGQRFTKTERKNNLLQNAFFLFCVGTGGSYIHISVSLLMTNKPPATEHR